MFDKELPIDANDVNYNAMTQEVSLKREKFDELIKFVRDLMEHSDNAAGEQAAAQYRARKADASKTVVEAILQELAEGSKAIKQWVDENSIKKLSERTGIPYATCHRIVTERLGTSDITIKELVTLLNKVSRTPSLPPVNVGHLPVIFVGPENRWGRVAGNLRGPNVRQASSGKQALTMAQEKQPGVIFVDVSMPGLNAKELLQLGQQKAPVVMVHDLSGEKLEDFAKGVSAVAEYSTGQVLAEQANLLVKK